MLVRDRANTRPIYGAYRHGGCGYGASHLIGKALEHFTRFVLFSLDAYDAAKSLSRVVRQRLIKSKGELQRSVGVLWEPSSGSNGGLGHGMTPGVQSIGSLPDHEILEWFHGGDAFDGLRTDDEVIAFYFGESDLIFTDPCGVSGNGNMLNHTFASQGVAFSACKRSSGTASPVLRQWHSLRCLC